jgi:hypothetical protein
VRFSILAVAFSDDIQSAQDRNAAVNDATAFVDQWIDTNYDKLVTCQICGDRGRVSPDDDNDLVVTAIPFTHQVFIACEDCLHAMTMTMVLSMEQGDAERLASRIMVEVIDRAKSQTVESAHSRVSHMVMLGRVVDLIDKRNDDLPSPSRPTQHREQTATVTALGDAFKRAAGVHHHD